MHHFPHNYDLSDASLDQLFTHQHTLAYLATTEYTTKSYALDTNALTYFNNNFAPGLLQSMY